MSAPAQSSLARAAIYGTAWRYLAFFSGKMMVFISTLVLARTAGASWEEAARLANAAAGIAVSHLGTSTVALGELKKAVRNNRFPNL